MKKKLFTLSFLLLLTSMLLIIGCTNDNTEPDSTTTTENTVTTVTTSPVMDEPTVNLEGNNLTALEVSALMGNGTNLGNTMEAYGHATLGIDADVSEYETIWRQPITTPDMIQGMKDAGFDSIRIPVAWTNMMDFENGDYTINKAYLDRVEEIVNYALNADMYVIVNDHWDGGWWGMFGSASEETRNQAMELYIAIWTQVGERFKDYSYKLILESGNEELGNRLNDIDIARDSGALSVDECYEMSTTINQAFVDTIRGQGSKNADRFLLIAGYNTDIEMTCDKRFKMPTDIVNDKLLLSVHYYTPWSYCGTSGVASWGTEKHYNAQNELLEKMTKFTDQGYGIVFGEYAVLTKSDGSLKNNTYDFTTNFLDNCDLYGYVPMLWDTNAFYIKEELKIADDGLADLYLNRCYDAQSEFTSEDLRDNAKLSMSKALDIAIENDKTSTGPKLNGDEQAVAWIMYNSLDYAVTYSVGDNYDPSLTSDGVIATDVVIDEAGTYTIGLDFTTTGNGYADTTSFAALGISNGELLFPGYVVKIKEILINGDEYKLTGVPYTTSDDDVCTRVNLYNGWVSELPENIRVPNPNMANFASPIVLDPQTLGQVESIYITFEYAPID